MTDKELIDILLDALVDASRELTADDIITEILREEKGLPHTPCPVLKKVNDAITLVDKN